MGKREPIRTTIKEAVDYWSRRVDECGISVDWSEADTHCWRCGCKKNLQRCHIVPDSLGGKDEPGNIVLLCSRCHADGPNVTDPEIMWDWIRAYGVPFYETFWQFAGMKEYQFIYKRSFSEEIKGILAEAGISEDDPKVQELIKNSMKHLEGKLGVHYGQPYINTATMAGSYRMMLKDLANSLGVDFPIKSNQEEMTQKPWWAFY